MSPPVITELLLSRRNLILTRATTRLGHLENPREQVTWLFDRALGQAGPESPGGFGLRIGSLAMEALEHAIAREAAEAGVPLTSQQLERVSSMLGTALLEAVLLDREAAHPRPAERPRSLEGLHLLVVDDEADARELLAIVLKEHGADVEEAGSAREALGKALSGRFDVLVSDIGMPNEDGYSFLRQLRRHTDKPWAAGLPALALTAYTGPHDRRLALEAGYQVHISKPIEPSKLVSAVAELVRR